MAGAGWLNVPGGLGGNCLGLRKAAGGSRELRAQRGPVLKVGAGQREPWSKASLRGFPRGELFRVEVPGSLFSGEPEVGSSHFWVGDREFSWASRGRIGAGGP